MKKQNNKWHISIAQALMGCLLIWLGHPYIGVAIAAIHF